MIAFAPEAEAATEVHDAFPSIPLPVRPSRILVLSVSAGAGHLRAAEALRSHAALRGAHVTAVHINVMEHVPAAFRRLYTDWYISLVNRHPAIWGWLYRVMDDARPDDLLQRLRRRLERWSAQKLLRKIHAFRPDAIVCTHFMPAEILAHLPPKASLSCPVWVQVTDFDLHRMWVQPGVTGYFAASEEVAFRLRAYGIKADASHVTGIPLMPAFDNPPNRRECAHEIGLDPTRMTVLLMGGGAGLGRLEKVAARLLALDADFQLIVLAGRNVDALIALRELEPHYPNRLRAHAYTDRIERLMACADLAVTKPGGLTTSECLALGLPMIIHAPIPGQEERNADFLLEQGVALRANDAATLEYRIHHLIRHPEKLADMRRRAQAIGRPAAARQVLDTVFRHGER